ncbi:MAG: COG1470 family protein [Planctomycetota bacterium]|jgi:hypothetical protein
MKMRKKKWFYCQTVMVVVSAMYLGSLAAPVSAVNNNGFETDWVYALKTRTSELSAYRESDGTLMDTLIDPFPGYPSPDHISNTCYDAWTSLTFSGTLANNDARLYVAAEIPRQDGDCGGSQHPNDIVMIEVGPEGCSFDGSDARKRVYLKDLLGLSQVGPHVRLGTIRYSSFHGSLFLSLCKDYTNNNSLVYIYQIDLELTTILNTYTGANVHNNEPTMDVDPSDGALYVTEANMGEPDPGGGDRTHLGDLIKIDTSGGSTGVFTTLIDGPTYSAGDILWTGPHCPIYRGMNNPSGRPALVMLINESYDINYALEFYLDANDGTYPPAGNLIKRGQPYTTKKFAWRGQLDEVTGTTMSTRLFDTNAGIDLYAPDDSTRRIVGPHGFQDVDSPGDYTISVLPEGDQETTASPGQAADPSSIDFTVRNKGYGSSFNYSVAELVDEPWLSLSKTSGGPLAPGSTDTVTANIDAVSMPVGHYTANLVFTDDNNSTNVVIRPITLHVVGTAYQVTPDPGLHLQGSETCNAGFSLPFTISKLGGEDFDYTVEETDAAGNPATSGWLVLSKTSGSCSDAQPDDTVSVSVTGSPTEGQLTYLKFTPNKVAVNPTEIRSIQLRVVGNVQTFSYNGDMDPVTPSSFGDGFTFYLPTATITNVARGSVVNYPIGTGANQTWDGKAWQMTKLTSEATRTVYAHTGDSSSLFDIGADHDQYLGGTVVARISVDQSRNMAANLMIHRPNKSGWTASQIAWGGNALNALSGRVRDTWRFQQVPPIEPNTSADQCEREDFVIIRLLAGQGLYGGHTVVIYYTDADYYNTNGSENPVPLLLIPNATGGKAEYARSFGFGIQNHGPTSEGTLTLDWITATNAGMFAPGDEVACTGVSLIPEPTPPCNDPFADHDGDHDVDQNDFAAFQLCYTGQGDPGGVYDAENCHCFNQEGADSDVDVQDFGKFRACASGPNVPANPACDDPAP